MSAHYDFISIEPTKPAVPLSPAPSLSSPLPSKPPPLRKHSPPSLSSQLSSWPPSPLLPSSSKTTSSHKDHLYLTRTNPLSLFFELLQLPLFSSLPPLVTVLDEFPLPPPSRAYVFLFGTSLPCLSSPPSFLFSSPASFQNPFARATVIQFIGFGSVLPF
jgi:hypothetical protein